ncbi:MAG: tetratricopeptide repeat protein [Coriobacteriia bacterium]
MSGERTGRPLAQRLRLGAVAVLLVAVLLGSQAAAAASAPSGGVASTGRVLGQTTSAYLGGLRTLTAAVLWNRIDPIFDGYYGTLDDTFTVFMPTIRLVQTLDPQFIKSYYIAAYFLAKQGHMDDALETAREGIANNPKSGLMRANLVQVMFMQPEDERDMAEMLRQSEIGLGDDMQWASSDDEFEGLGIFRTAYNLAGDTETAAKIDARQKTLVVPTTSADEHDHDHE